MSAKVVAAVEGGGSSFRVVVCYLELNDDTAAADVNFTVPTIVARTDITDSSDHPERTLTEICQFLQTHKPEQGFYDGLGIATFGPVGVKRQDRETYGCILPSTPKPAWRNVNLLQPLLEACSDPSYKNLTRNYHAPAVLVDTDVNAPALSEYLQYNSTALSKISSLAYITVGTGVGVGLIVNGQPVHGRMHPEAGHCLIQSLPNDTFAGYSWGPAHCPFQGQRTVEGTACSVALRERLEQKWNQTLDPAILTTVGDDEDVWDHAANAIANLCVTLLLVLSIERIVLGGGIIMNRQHILMDKIRTRTRELLNGYLPLPDDLSELIVTPYFGDDAGLTGAMILAAQAVRTGSHIVNEDEAMHEKEVKQTAFGAGIMNGVAIGALSAGLLMKYMGGPKKK